jgi:hypothetical protein
MRFRSESSRLMGKCHPSLKVGASTAKLPTVSWQARRNVWQLQEHEGRRRKIHLHSIWHGHQAKLDLRRLGGGESKVPRT